MIFLFLYKFSTNLLSILLNIKKRSEQNDLVTDFTFSCMSFDDAVLYEGYV
ncbi:hypothetical protein CHCC20347_0106 [Bacillus paralicheniformis]|nr:hypothetical protein CHCC20347_0106 [Bacillus paralicheniformis]